MITIPFKEYEELIIIKRSTQSDNMKVYVKRENFGSGCSSQWWEIYTKDIAVRRLTDELIETRNELEEMKAEQSKKEKQPSIGRAVLNLILIGLVLFLTYLIFK